MDWDYDICFCTNFECKKHDCRRHQINTPQDVLYLSFSEFKLKEDGNCDYYLKRGI